MHLFANKYRIGSARLKNYDYGANGAYFITICTADKKHFFGKVFKYKMHLSENGLVAHKVWMEIANHFPFVVLGEWMIMPNHMHAVIVIDDLHQAANHDKIKRGAGITQQHNPMNHANLSTIIRRYKAKTTFEIRKQQSDFTWQARFHDRIIRNEIELRQISEYIIDNPLNWSYSKEV